MPFVMGHCDFPCPRLHLQEVRGLVWQFGVAAGGRRVALPHTRRRMGEWWIVLLPGDYLGGIV